MANPKGTGKRIEPVAARGARQRHRHRPRPIAATPTVFGQAFGSDPKGLGGHRHDGVEGRAPGKSLALGDFRIPGFCAEATGEALTKGGPPRARDQDSMWERM